MKMIYKKKTKKNISVIVVSFNTKKKTIKTLNSIFNQTYKDKEIIVIDGKSTDGTVKFLKDNKSTVNYVSEKDKGIYFAMNKGIKLAKSNWIIFLNSGDLFHGSHILDRFSKKNFKNFDVIYGNTIIKNNIYKRSLFGKKLKHLSTKMTFSHQSVFVKTKILKKNIFNTKYKIASDFDLFQKLMKRDKLFYHFNFFISKISTGGISDVRRFRCLFEYFQIFLANKKFVNIFLLLFDILYLTFRSLLIKIISKKLFNKLLLSKYRLLDQIN